MKITVVGWYGTETIGDRAILAGLISFFNKSFDNFVVHLGSLYPFFSLRTLNEDYSFYKEIVKKDLNIEIFNSKNIKALDNAINRSDFVAMGGGPLMDLDELFMLEYAFKKAKSKGIKTALLGCGIGPLFHKKYRKSVAQIVQHSDLIILRDSNSKNSIEEICKEQKIITKRIHATIDPAVECVLQFNLKAINKNEESYIAVNLREFPLSYVKDGNAKNIDKDLKQFVRALSHNFKDREIRMIPMHYFYVGGDDRVFLNTIAIGLKCENITVNNANLSLKETIQVYQKAYFNIGMRFHSVVIQTIVSGKNYVLDYTEPKKGKISSFLKDIDTNGFYEKRYISLQDDQITAEIICNTDAAFTFDHSRIHSKLNVYTDKLNKLMNFYKH